MRHPLADCLRSTFVGIPTLDRVIVPFRGEHYMIIPEWQLLVYGLI